MTSPLSVKLHCMTSGKRAPEDAQDRGMVVNATRPRFRATLQPPLSAMVVDVATDCRAETSAKRNIYQTESAHANAIFSEADDRIVGGVFYA